MSGDEDYKRDSKKDKKDKKESSKKRDRDDEEEEGHTDKRRKAEPSESHRAVSDDEFVRRRTRSMSDAEEHFKLSRTDNADEFRKLHQITLVGKSDDGSEYKSPDPLTTFASTPFSPQIRRALDAAGYSNPTPTQAQSWPIALQGRDIITVAKTGSGKTCGFLLPAFHRLVPALEKRRRGVPGILVLAPTRELACQIEEEAVKFGRSSNIRSACVYGGAPKGLQIRKLQTGVEILIATPGRLNDLIEMRAVDLSQILFLVLDEADRM